AHFTPGAASYRAYRFAWRGRPSEPPALALHSDLLGRVSAYVSWNGATEVASWQVLAGPDPGHPRPLRTVAKTGFETRIDLGHVRGPYAVVRALDRNGRPLRQSTAQKLPFRSPIRARDRPGGRGTPRPRRCGPRGGGSMGGTCCPPHEAERCGGG